MIAISLVLTAFALIWFSRPYSIDLYRYVVWHFTHRNWQERGVVPSNDACITYRVIRNPAVDSSRAPLVLLHGGFGSYLDWYAQIPTLAQDHLLVLIDTRGHGRSTFGNRTLKYDLFSKDAMVVLDRLELALVDVAGWSDGGITGLLLARDHPERIRRLIAISVNAQADGLTDLARQRLESGDSTGSGKSRILRHLLSPEPGRWGDLTQGLEDLWQDDPWLLETEMRTIITPTLIIAGSNDDVRQRHLGDMTRAIPHASLTILPGVGHTVPQSAPAQVLHLMSQFLDSAATPVTS